MRRMRARNSGLKGWVLAGACACLFAAAPLHAATELQGRPVTPSPPKADERQLKELYDGYLDCINTSALDEECYWRWSAQCEAHFGEVYCDWLEETMFPDPLPGNDSC
jgi:hypothetical protein